MLENIFYVLKKSESNDHTYRAILNLNQSHEIFKAHFPGNPIVPGVCLLQMTKELLNAKFVRNFRLIYAKNIKFLKVINPLDNPEIEFIMQYRIENDLIFVDTSIVSGEIVFARISATFNGY